MLRAAEPKAGGQSFMRPEHVAAVFQDPQGAVHMVLTNGQDLVIAQDVKAGAKGIPGVILTTNTDGSDLAINPLHIMGAVENAHGGTIVYINSGLRAYVIPMSVADIKARCPT